MTPAPGSSNPQPGTQPPLAPGDIVEIETPAGLAYVQVTHNHASYPEVVRALAGLHSQRPADLTGLAQGKTAFTGMIPLGEMLASGRLPGRRLGPVTVPREARAFPTFRTPIRDRQGDVVYWWFWDGEGLHYSTDPGTESQDWPLREVIGAKDLIARLAAMA
ncbi:MAG: hypothetical protein JJU19_03675 [Pararhodobacter sp.]|nr:hypothetical protein [Pararhodobacter sp.]